MIAGFAGRTPPPEASINGSVNGALLSLTKSLAERGRLDGIRINTVNPGQIRTSRFEKRVEHLMRTLSITAAEAEDKMARDYGMIRTGEPEDVADLVAFAVSQRAGFLHGAVIDLDGGMTKTI
jgi:3-oxoacyl-[acyl-carrier protein] reductase